MFCSHGWHLIACYGKKGSGLSGSALSPLSYSWPLYTGFQLNQSFQILPPEFKCSRAQTRPWSKIKKGKKGISIVGLSAAILEMFEFIQQRMWGVLTQGWLWSSQQEVARRILGRERPESGRPRVRWGKEWGEGGPRDWSVLPAEQAFKS